MALLYLAVLTATVRRCVADTSNEQCVSHIDEQHKSQETD
jgi:hypothetical protein